MAPAINNNNDDQDVFIYPILVIPEFEENIPEYLLKGADDQSKYIIRQLSVICQQNEWLIKTAVSASIQINNMDKRIKKIEAWKRALDDKNIESKINLLDRFLNFWSILAAIILGLGSISGFLMFLAKAFHIIS